MPTPLVKGDNSRGAFAKRCRRHNIRRKFTAAITQNSTGLAGMAAQVQAQSLFPGFEIPSGSRLWSARNHWACYALNRTATRVNVGNKSPFEMCFGYGTAEPDRFPQAEVRKNVTSGQVKPKGASFFFIGPSPNRPRNTLQVLLYSESMAHSRNVTGARVPFHAYLFKRQ